MLSFYILDGKSAERWQTLAKQCQRILEEQQITPESPGTILRDVATLIEFVGSGGIATKGRNANLPIDCLPELNRRTSYPIEPGLKRALLQDYPNLAGTFILLRVMDTIQARGNRLVVWPAALEFWRGLNPTEQYFALLEALLFQAQTSVLGGEIRRQEAQELRTTVIFLGQLSDRWRNFDHYESARDLGVRGQIPPWYLFLLQQFGLVEIRPVPLAEQKLRDWGGRGWLVGGARLTPWGTAMTWALLEFWKASEREDEDADISEDPPEADLEESPDDLSGAEQFGVLQPHFQPCFPEWRTIFVRPKREVRCGTHIFKVILTGWRGGGGGIWRRLAVAPNTTLDELAGAILQAFALDSDHLYDFRYRDQRGNSRIYNHPYTDEGPFATEITVAETELARRAEMEFRFDYGDNWEFKVRLEEIVTGPYPSGPDLVESAGTPPKQYPQTDF